MRWCLPAILLFLISGCGATGTSTAGEVTAAMGTAGTTAGATADITGTTTDATAAPSACAAASSELYEKRIAPLLATDRPKTCNTCHLSGVDLQIFVQATPCQSMACLADRGLVDLENPAASVVLQWISRADPSSPLIDQGVIDEEYAAFLAWIEATAECGLCFTGDAPCGGPSKVLCDADLEPGAYQDPGDCAPITREALFRHKVYAWRDRCYPCHFDNKQSDAPHWLATGPCELASLTTMRTVLDGGLVDLADPAASMLLLKPLAESAGGVMHGGHDKFNDTKDPAYIDFLTWIEREAACTP